MSVSTEINENSNDDNLFQLDNFDLNIKREFCSAICKKGDWVTSPFKWCPECKGSNKNAAEC